MPPLGSQTRSSDTLKAPVADRPTLAPKPEKATTSWWLQTSREAFTEAAKTANARMQQQSVNTYSQAPSKE